MTKEEKKAWLKNVDLNNVKFEVKIADFGLSKKLKSKKELSETVCGTPFYMSP